MPTKAELFGALANGQSPPTLFITCADSRIDPSLLTQTDPGDMFVVRNAGNIVPALDDDQTSNDGTAASIEYAVAALGVAHIVVCGHSCCGAMTAVAQPELVDSLPSVARWLDRSGVVANGESLPELLEQNVLVQLDRLRTYPSVKAALDAGSIELHGWVYDIGSGQVRAYDGSTFAVLS